MSKQSGPARPGTGRTGTSRRLAVIGGKRRVVGTNLSNALRVETNVLVLLPFWALGIPLLYPVGDNILIFVSTEKREKTMHGSLHPSIIACV